MSRKKTWCFQLRKHKLRKHPSFYPILNPYLNLKEKTTNKPDYKNLSKKYIGIKGKIHYFIKTT